MFTPVPNDTFTRSERRSTLRTRRNDAASDPNASRFQHLPANIPDSQRTFLVVCALGVHGSPYGYFGIPIQEVQRIQNF